MKIKHQQGVGLVEVLVALILLSIGVLGFSILQVRAMDASLDASKRIQAMNLARDLSERMRANKSGLSKSIPSDDDEDEKIDAYSKALKGKTSLASHTPACMGATKCSTQNFAQEDANQVLYKAYTLGMKLALNECPGTMSSERYCVYVAWGETLPQDGGTNACTNGGSILADSKCIVLEAY